MPNKNFIHLTYLYSRRQLVDQRGVVSHLCRPITSHTRR